MHIDHIAMYVKDLEAAKEFFVKYFNASSNVGYHNKTTDFRSYFLTFDDGSRIEIMNKPQMEDGEKALTRTGYAHIAFTLESRAAVDELTERLKNDGYQVVSGPRVTGDGYYESCIIGIEGNQIEITSGEANMNLHETARIARGAIVYGDVTIGEKSSVWYNAVVRGDQSTIEIGKYSNVQDNCTVHVDNAHPVKIGDYVTIGHGAIIHGCTIGNNCLIGMGAIILNDAVIEDNCIIGAGSLVTQGKVIPEGSMVLGSPGKVIRPITEEERTHLLENAIHYAEEEMR